MYLSTDSSIAYLYLRSYFDSFFVTMEALDCRVRSVVGRIGVRLEVLSVGKTVLCSVGREVVGLEDGCRVCEFRGRLSFGFFLEIMFISDF